MNAEKQKPKLLDDQCQVVEKLIKQYISKGMDDKINNIINRKHTSKQSDNIKDKTKQKESTA